MAFINLEFLGRNKKTKDIKDFSTKEQLQWFKEDIGKKVG